ncbi:flippase [Candidatus Woesearchaeota archaeon]|nr:flippase [Candidatus Woesearchaeota archaeon]
MSNAETIAKNAGFLFIGEIVTRVLAFGLVVAIAHYLGEIGLGAYSFAFAFTDLLLQFVDLGIPSYIMREIARDKTATPSYISNALGLRTSMLPFILLIGVAAAYLIQAKSAETRIILLLATTGMGLNFLTDPLRTVYLAYEQNSYYAALTIFERLIFTAGGFALLITGQGLVPILGLFVASQLISFLTNAYIVRKRFANFTISFNKALVIDTIKRAFPFWLTNLLRTVYLRADTLMLSAMKGFATAGWYNAAYRPVEALTAIPLVIVASTFPAMSRMHVQSRETLKILYEKTFYYLLIAAFPLAAGLTLAADRIILFFYGQTFSASIIVLKMLAWAEALLFLHLIMGFLLNAINKQHLFTITTATYAATNVALNLFMIPKYGHIGAATAAIITQVIAVLMLYYFCARNGYGLNLLKLAYKPIIAVSAMSAVLIASKNVNLLVAAPTAAIVYVAILALVKGIGKEELGLIRKVLRLA